MSEIESRTLLPYSQKFWIFPRTTTSELVECLQTCSARLVLSGYLGGELGIAKSTTEQKAEVSRSITLAMWYCRSSLSQTQLMRV